MKASTKIGIVTAVFTLASYGTAIYNAAKAANAKAEVTELREHWKTPRMKEYKDISAALSKTIDYNSEINLEDLSLEDLNDGAVKQVNTDIAQLVSRKKELLSRKASLDSAGVPDDIYAHSVAAYKKENDLRSEYAAMFWVYSCLGLFTGLMGAAVANSVRKSEKENAAKLPTEDKQV